MNWFSAMCMERNQTDESLRGASNYRAIRAASVYRSDLQRNRRGRWYRYEVMDSRLYL